MKLAFDKDYIKKITVFLFLCLLIEVYLSRYLPRLNISLFYLISSYVTIILIFSLFLGKLIGFYFSIFFVFILNLINRIKYKNTNEPIGYFDVASPENFSIVFNYIEYWHLIFLFLLIYAIYFLCKKGLFKKNKPISLNEIFLLIIFFSFTLPFSSTAVGNFIHGKFANVEFNSWRLDSNVRNNGLINHLYQTSKISIPLVENVHDNNISSVYKVGPNNLGNIYFVMCESCWDENNEIGFSSDLVRKGFYYFNLISPVYGGGTVNSAFEILTGMASKSELSGIIYQGYADLIKNDVMAYPRMLKSIGYKTFELHHNKKTFWRRHIVSPKLGFDFFYGSESMPETSSYGFPRDNVLYEKTLSLLEEGNIEKSFYFLTTIHSHGKFVDKDGDLGLSDYSSRVKLSVEDFLSFFDNVIKKDPEATFLFFGDHKPGMNQFFEKKGYIDNFKNWESVGRVPAFIYSNSINSNKFKNFDGMPFYCFSYLFSSNLNGLINDSMKFLDENNICSKNNLPKNNYIDYPNDLYFKFLLKQ